MMPNRFQRLLITLPLLALPLVAHAVTGAHAASGAAEEAVRILSRAKAADGRCKLLSASERAELSGYAARAEVAAVSQSGAKAARKAAGEGVAQGASGGCGDDVKADVRDTLQAAREAMAAARTETADPAPTKRKLTDSTERKPVRTRNPKVLDRYASAVQAYYLERQCKSLSKSEQGRFWKGIVRLHKDAVMANGAGAVKPVMRQAERRAVGSGCGATALARIRAGYEEILSR
jgi:hypothetical protein